MIIYLSNLLIVIICSFLASREKINKKLKMIIYVLMLFSLILLAGLRWKVGTDFMTYYYLTDKIFTVDIFKLLMSESYSTIPLEKGFCLFVWLLGLIYKNPQFVFFIISTITIILIVNTLKKYSDSFPISMYLYITTMVYYSAFNGLRQWLACAIIFWAIKYIYENKKIKYILLTLIAATLHSSILIMIPIYFIIQKKKNNRFNFIFLIIAIIISFSLVPIFNKINVFFENTKYEKYLTVNPLDDGVNILRILVAVIPVVITTIYYKKLTKDDDKASILINLSLINAMFYIIAFNNTYFARFNIYFEPYNLLLYPKIINLIKNKNQKYLMIFMIAILFFAYMVLLLPKESNLLPYRTIFNKMN